MEKLQQKKIDQTRGRAPKVLHFALIALLCFAKK
jgi:hypothetical protein